MGGSLKSVFRRSGRSGEKIFEYLLSIAVKSCESIVDRCRMSSNCTRSDRTIISLKSRDGRRSSLQTPPCSSQSSNAITTLSQESHELSHT
jgi:hypothetical protein